MAGVVRLRLGDLFDQVSDLLVLPCSSIPSVTDFVRQRLDKYGLPNPNPPLSLGEVQFRPAQQLERFAAWVAYAVSVDRGYGTSKPLAIKQIGQSLGRFGANQESVREIAAPLLGAGAGGLPAETAARELRAGFLETAPDHTRLSIYVLQQSIFEDLSHRFSQERTATGHVLSGRQPVRVFVSYTRTDDRHAAWVEAVVRYLRSVGIDARLDKWHLRMGMDVVQWMCNELDLAERVLLICNEEYANRANARRGGVGWEIRLVQGDILITQQDNPDRYIPVVRSERPEDGLPHFLRTTKYLHWKPSITNESGLRTELADVICRRHEEAPPLGEPPDAVL